MHTRSGERHARALAMAAVTAVAASWTEVAHARDFFAPEERTRTNTAYTLAPSQLGFEVGALGQGGGDVYARIGVAYGFGYGVEVSANLAHAAAGIVNLNGKWNFIDEKMFGLAAGVGVTWAHGDWLWVLPADQRTLVSTLDVVAVPLTLTASAPVLTWLQLDLELSYLHAEVFGNANSENALFDADIGARRVGISPIARFYVLDALELYASVWISPYTALPGAVTARAQLAPDVYAGGQTGGYIELDPGDTYRLAFGARSAITRTSFVSFVLNYGKASERLYGSSFFPAFNVELRF